MLQVDHVYEFFFKTFFKGDFEVWSLPDGVVIENLQSFTDFHIFTKSFSLRKKIFFYDQEPILEKFAIPVLDIFTYHFSLPIDELIKRNENNDFDYNYPATTSIEMLEQAIAEITDVKSKVPFVVSEKSNIVNNFAKNYQIQILYYFFHGFAALDWYRGFYALNYNKNVLQQEYKFDYVTFNRLTTNDRSYRCYFVAKLIAEDLMSKGRISFGLDTSHGSWQNEINSDNSKLSISAKEYIKTHLPKISIPLLIDSDNVPGSASADIPRCINDSLWHVVTETVFYYDKLHLTEKIFKPIVMKQPFMLLAAPGNLAYLKSYGFKTFDSVIDEGYDNIQDPDQRIDHVVNELKRLCNMSPNEKRAVLEAIAPIVEYNFHHFYGEFKHIITKELLNNCKKLFKEIGYDDSTIAYEDIYKVLTN